MTRVAVVLLLVHDVTRVVRRAILLIVLAGAAGLIVAITRDTARDPLVHRSALKALLRHALAETAAVRLVTRAHLCGAVDVAALLGRRLRLMVARVLRLSRLRLIKSIVIVVELLLTR